MLAAPDIHPVAEGALVDPQVTGDLGDRLAGLEHHLHGFGLELRTELPPLLGHGRILSSQRTCPRSLVHPTRPCWADGRTDAGRRAGGPTGRVCRDTPGNTAAPEAVRLPRSTPCRPPRLADLHLLTHTGSCAAASC